MSDNRALYVEEAIIEAVKRLLAGRVNEILADAEFPVPPVEFGGYVGRSAVVPVIVLSTCERIEKERINRLDAYTLSVTFSLPDNAPFAEANGVDGELSCYAYAAAVEKAIAENPVLDGVASRAVLTGKKYVPPKKPHCGDGWELVLTVRLTIEGMNNAGQWL
jgi:hypothetical protein